MQVTRAALESAKQEVREDATTRRLELRLAIISVSVLAGLALFL